eukprot:TRINITY_DN9249_c1_g1_i3.p1 TRINITY_DN9249_c1_g1~~TRINITY_DN9249_c1_g1_i3.p1  ORF type:complete len:358 (-),score=51.56 TRINITY_DN9249_c1_g1_i3:44-1030(-)
MGSSFMIINFLVFSKKRGISRLVIYLALGDYFWAVSELVTFGLLLYNPDMFTWPVCVVMRVIFQFFASSTIFWTCCIAIFMFMNIFFYQKMTVEVFDKAMIVFKIISWGIPAITCITVVAGKMLYQSHPMLLCEIREPFHFLVWFFPLMIVMAIAVVIYAILLRHLHVSMKLEQEAYKQRNHMYHPLEEPKNIVRKSSSNVSFRLSLYIVVFILSWSLNIIDYGIQYFTGCSYFGILLVSNTMLQAQGFMDCIVYGLTNKNLRQKYDGFIPGIIAFLFSPLLIVPIVLRLSYQTLSGQGINADIDDDDATAPINREKTSYSVSSANSS